MTASLRPSAPTASEMGPAQPAKSLVEEVGRALVQALPVTRRVAQHVGPGRGVLDRVVAKIVQRHTAGGLRRRRGAHGCAVGSRDCGVGVGEVCVVVGSGELLDVAGLGDQAWASHFQV